MYSAPTITAALAGFASVAMAGVAGPKQLEARQAPPKNGYSGKATVYGGNLQGGTCSFSTMKELPAGLFGVAMTDSIWNNGYNCGGCVEVKSGGKKIKAMVVDKCPGCGPGHLDLFPDAYAKFSGNPGIIDVDWQFVDCKAEITEPLQIRLKEGVSSHWFSAQVVGATRRTKKMEYRKPGGQWINIAKREDHNMFTEASGVGAKVIDIRVTSHVGTQVVVNGIAVEGDSKVENPAKANYK
ncbi:MAG: hypothetical protein M1831_005376 [Alyxoria varia]|nr:MAG: hypothetical protein M1831_005376 [Alyxoria varia]